MSGLTLVLVLGDQLDRRSPALSGCRPGTDPVLMIEARGESTRVPSHKVRSALFLAAMRHHAAWLQSQGHLVDYVGIDTAQAQDFESAVVHALRRHRPARVRMVEAGEHGVQARIGSTCRAAGVTLETIPDPHFLCSRDAFDDWAGQRRSLTMEHFYRHMRRTHGILVEDGAPVGGHWNYDRNNRRSFGRAGPGLLAPVAGFAPDEVTRGALDDVARLFPDNPGDLARFDWPVTREQAMARLGDFVEHHLAAFGPHQDAMWDGAPFLHHSAISAALNLKLLDPREVIDAALEAWRNGTAPLASVEGFVRQVLGWREFVRGIYWREMPGYLERNALDARRPLPGFYWTGATDMACLRSVIGQTLEFGYAHHIQRLMVTGLFALLLGVRPQEVHAWYLAVYVDAVEWVEAPNTLGMSQYADGGLLASKPYAASGRYIQRMGNHCASCRFDPGKAVGDDACPFTTLYWDFLMRHAERFASHPRAALQWRSLERLDPGQRRAIRRQAEALFTRLA
jgi:deoxyribodipyrimidine photolyase-related protein